MFRIGEFSRIGSVTIETLRHYDALGLLKPAHVDPFTGYRYYSAGQLPRLNRIIALKEVGFSLEEIARILHDNLSPDELRGMLKAQLVLTESAIATAQVRRDRILTRLNSLNMEEAMPAYEVTLKSVDALTIAAIRERVPTLEQVPQRWGEMFNTLASWLTANGLPFGLPMTLYHNEGYTREDIDTECAFIIHDTALDKVARPVAPIMVRPMAAVSSMATTVVADWKAEGLEPAYRALGQWIEAHEYHIVGAPRELYYGSPEKGDYTVEIQFPVEKEVLIWGR
ncbi:MAG TPA: MerR family transcriptional regulator [Anaerolineae bacterium]|nr:MerR family transcriptional regulator [Anaerolineae bacterium]